MSNEYVEIAKRAMDALDQFGGIVGGGDPLPLLREFFDPDVEMDLSRQGVDPEIYHGYEGCLRMGEQYRDAWQELRMEVEEAIDAGDSVVLFTHNTGLARSGIKLGVRVGYVLTFRDGKIVRWQYFGEDRLACLEAAGLAGWAMSAENVENLRAFLETWSREAWRPQALARPQREPDLSLLDPDVTFEDTVMPDHVGETYRGHEGVVRAGRSWTEAYEWLLVELEQIIDAGDRLVSIHRFRARARYTGIEFDAPVAYVWTFRHGKVIHYRSFPNRERALKAAGLEQ
jgi:ketosteroid isomerase-like protein